jgi:hypothetical protein
MASGLPVIATREGGMAEMISNGHTGFLTESSIPEQLASALRGALSLSPEQLSEMGRKAAAAIKQSCNPSKVAEAHFTLRSQLVRRGSDDVAKLRRELSVRFPEFSLGNYNNVDRLLDIVSMPTTNIDASVWNERLTLARVALRFPSSTARHVGRRLRNKFRRQFGNFFCGSSLEAS